MKLNPVQWLWMIAAGIFFVVVLLDIGGVIKAPIPALIIVPVVLALTGWVVGPSLRDLSRANRRG